MHRRARRHPVPLLTAAVLVGAIVAGCSSDDDGSSASEAPPASATADATASGTGTPSPTESALPLAEFPDTPAGQQARWVLEQLAAETGPDAQNAAERFSDVFLAEIPADQVSATFDGLRELGPFTPVEYSGDARQAMVELVGSGSSRYRMSLGVDRDDAISGLFVQPAAEAPTVTSWSEFTAALSDTGADVALYAARDDGGTWAPLHQTSPDELRPLGSMFKLYVLGAVQRAVLDGDVNWDDTLTVTDEVRSLPSGELQDAPDGAGVTVAEAAEKMISISDNTATDMLIDLVGRDSVEAAVADMGHHDPAAMQPFLTTGEFFRLGWTDPDLPDRWSDATVDERRSILADLPADISAVDVPAVTAEPRWESGIEWFAAPADVAAAHRSLQELASQDEADTVRDLLAVNSGLAIDAGDWPYVAFKGGSSAGVLAFSWYLENPDGIGHTLVVQLRSDNPNAVADQAYVTTVVQQAFDLLADG
ncbi:serine hydrolase [Phytoactinopolyspora halotolerans]|uniref:Serine hydrolase n=1 Tax=Phytoactinopolyspora halotolerans TaxID=1981512 RepID=A0A6L9S9Y0_9ACTN|nr:Cpe/LpqF family protein [Phytoactinopolyspora halotolerans]NEE01444.1 serine hydrolase [Phytoactinopolyspora halotolerans]